VAKILVADDNSNIQKMVGLALKDHGIDVVAVGNGEAAVRKIVDIRPDLVLADVFMPVRNGYEVCKYVKDDKALAHIPVILLVGAFDPLDEQEAQRVGADGVLKKPFVPPDPLISMVKAALVRAGVAHAGFTPAKPVEEVVPTPEVAALRRDVPTSAAVPKAFVPEVEMESFVDEVPLRPAALKIESGKEPVAFGSLLEMPATDEEAPEVATAPAAPGMERDWRSSKTEKDDEGEDRAGWRRDAGGESFADQPAGSSRDLRSSRQGAWTPTREKEHLTAAAETEERIAAGLPERRDPPPSSPFVGEAWAAAIEAGSKGKTAVAEVETPIARAVEPQPVADLSPAVMAIDSSEVETPKPSTTSSWFSTPPNPWEAEAQKASHLASTWDATVAGEAGTRRDVSPEPASASDKIEAVSGNGVSSGFPTKAMETVCEEASQAVEHAQNDADGAATPADAGQVVHDAVAHLDMDALVAKVLARLSPGLLHDATRELLKPVVEAVIREELNSRKL
jgi:CheY-like chemotaxis protein